MPNELVLLADDEPAIIQLARLALEQEGYRVQEAADGLAALEAARQNSAEMLVLDVMLPGLDGFEVCRCLRAEGNPIAIIVLTARNEDVDKVLGLELGADDCLTKPFNPLELVARVKAILRRSERSAPWAASKVIRLGDLIIDMTSREVHLAEKLVDLRAQEFDLLLALAEHRGLVLSREQLLQLAWGGNFHGQTRTVDVHVAHLRLKIQKSCVRIETVTGIGYKLAA